jgi:small subunit ribosomal protein S1
VRTTDPAKHVGQTYTFKIIEFKNGGKDLVVSRRVLLAADQAANAVEVRQSIVLGAVMTGRVVSVREFGAFVDLGAGIQGLLHVSEMAWARVSDASGFSPGQEITVKVLRLAEDGKKISLGLKQLSVDPWSTVASGYEAGQVRTGRVTRLVDFGALVELEPGVEGLAHASTFPPTGHPNGWKKSVSVGMAARFEILSIDADKRSTSDWLRKAPLAPASAKAIEDAAEAEELRDYKSRADAGSSGSLGSMADQLRGALTRRVNTDQSDT